MVKSLSSIWVSSLFNTHVPFRSLLPSTVMVVPLFSALVILRFDMTAPFLSVLPWRDLFKPFDGESSNQHLAPIQMQPEGAPPPRGGDFARQPGLDVLERAEPQASVGVGDRPQPLAPPAGRRLPGPQLHGDFSPRARRAPRTRGRRGVPPAPREAPA